MVAEWSGNLAAVRRKPVVIIIRDGWGENPYPEWNRANAVHLAKTPVADALMRNYPHVLIHTSGEEVGLPQGVMGNSEVGHQNIGAGRIVDQEVMRITRAIRDGSFFENPVLRAAMDHVRSTGGSLHMLGLIFDGRVHSDLEHAFAVIELARRYGIRPDRLIVHAITDGRDTAPTSGLGFIEQLESRLAEAGVGRIGSVIGRYYAMDRDLRWDRVRSAYELLTRGIYVIGFSYPAVPHGAARIRMQVSAAHTTEQIDRAIASFTEVGKQLGVLK